MLGRLNLTMATLTLRTSLFCTTWEKNGANPQIEHWQTKMRCTYLIAQFSTII